MKFGNVLQVPYHEVKLLVLYLDSDHISVTRQSSVMDISNEAPPTPTSFEKRNNDGNNSSFEDLTTIGQSGASSSSNK